MPKLSFTSRPDETDYEPKGAPSVRDKLLRKLLGATLDRPPAPRIPPGRRGRPKDSSNYRWTRVMDKALKKLCDRLGPSQAKRIMQEKLMEMRDCKAGQHQPRPDSVRNAVERRMRFLGLPTGRRRQKPASGKGAAKPWKPSQISGLLGSLGRNLTDKSVEGRTKHTINAARAKLRRLGYTAEELRSVAFTTGELAVMLHVTARQLRRWKERGWLKTTRRRVTDKDLAAFIADHQKLTP